MQKIGLGGGCHWCTEAVFQALEGVTHVAQGWISPDTSVRSFSEGVIVTFDERTIPLSTLIEIHLMTHSSSSSHSLRHKYRSAIYVYSENQHAQTARILEDLTDTMSREFVTQVLRIGSFRQNKESLLNYYKTRPDAPFCETYIKPKLKLIQKTHQSFVKT